MRRIGRRGQSLTEYAIVFSVVAAAVVGMQVFMKRGLQAKQKAGSDYFTKVGGAVAGVPGSNLATTSQYEPYYALSKQTIETDRSSKVAVGEGFTVDTTGISETTKRRSGGVTEQGTDGSQDATWR